MEREGSEMYFSSTRTHEAFELSLCLLSISGCTQQICPRCKKEEEEEEERRNALAQDQWFTF